MKNYIPKKNLNSSRVSFNSSNPALSEQNSFSSMISCPAPRSAVMCEYCKTKNHDLLIKCIDNSCNRWFCNSDKVKVKGAKKSHIFIHLKELDHKMIELHRSRKCKIGKIECFTCKHNKVFALGMILDSHKIMCRDCLIKSKLNCTNWKNLITFRPTSYK